MWAHQSRDLGAQVIIAPLRIKKNEATRGDQTHTISQTQRLKPNPQPLDHYYLS
jgi:hypothetical protein